MRTRNPFIKRGFLVALSLTLACCTAASADTPAPQPQPLVLQSQHVGSQSFAFSAGSAAAFQQKINEYVWTTAVAHNEEIAAQQAAAAAVVHSQSSYQGSSDSSSGYHGNSTGSVNGYPCGGDLPPCYVLARESGGNPTAQNRISTASGLWQFLDTTWNNFMGYAKARLAPASVQNEKARIVWAGGAGCSNWAAC